jgi:hypothetical protein
MFQVHSRTLELVNAHGDDGTRGHDLALGESPLDTVAYIRFAHGPVRPVFEVNGRQFVVDDDGDRIYGVWYIPPEDAAVPIIVEAGGRPVEDF